MQLPFRETRGFSGQLSRPITARLLGVIAASVAVVAIAITGSVLVLNNHRDALPDNGLALTPPMGWNSWNQVGCAGLNEKVVESAADALVTRGLQKVGFEYVVIDDCWQGARTASGELTADATRFPHGIAAIAAYVHAKGLRFGIYAVPGSETCANYYNGYPVRGIGSIAHESQDATTFANWGVDYLKYDWCRADVTNGLSEQPAFAKMALALRATGRPIVYSISEYGEQRPWLWAPGIANVWRTTHDIHPTWSSIMSRLNAQATLAEFARPGGWNDPDMLEVGNGSLTPTETTAHFGMWCMLAAPLFLGTSIDGLPANAVGVLTNPELIAIDQDSLGSEARRVSDAGGVQVWTRRLADGSFAIAILNGGAAETTATLSLAQAGVPMKEYTVRNVIEQTVAGSTSFGVSGFVPAHGLIVFRLTPAS